MNKKYFVFLLIFVLLSCTKTGDVASKLDVIEPDYFICEVLRVLKADLFYCQSADKNILKVKLIGVEIDKSKKEEGKMFVRSLLPRGTLVRIEMDSYKWDNSGNLLAYVFIPGGRMLNIYLIESGYGEQELTEPNFKYKEIFYDLYKEDELNFDQKKEKDSWLR